jgi:ABC-type sugar transport system substrate-binding protein
VSTAASNTYYWISQDSTLPLFVQNDHVGLKPVVKRLGVNMKLAGPTNINLQQFIATINQVCAQHPAGVIVVGWDPSLTAPVNQCVESGVPVVTDDADLPDSKRLAFVGTDWHDIGVAQATALIAATGGKGDVATTSIINADNMRLARQGFNSTIAAKAPGMRIVANEDDGGDRSKAASVVANILAANPNLAGIAGFDAESGPGIVRALTEAGKIGQVKVTSMEAEPAFFNEVKNGHVAAVIVQKRELFIAYALQLLYDYNNLGLGVEGLPKSAVAPIPAVINTGLAVVTKDNVSTIKVGS